MDSSNNLAETANQQLNNQSPNKLQGRLKQQRSPRVSLIPLAGLGEVGRNMMLLEYRSQILIIDAGFRMPEEDMPGIDYIIPNISYLRGKERSIVGAVFTHGHYDHIGAIPYAWNRIGNPRIFAGKLAKSIIANRQEEFPYQPKLDITEVYDGFKAKLGPFQVEFFRQNHNIPNNFGLFIQTAAGNIVHTSDFKFDEAPVNDLPTDFERLEKIGQRGITFLLSDSTGAENEGHSLSEQIIFENLENLFQEAKGRIISSTFASHLNRIQQIIALSEKYGRKVFLEGFSMKANVEVARALKYLHVKSDTILKPSQISKYPDQQISFLCTGAQGETGAVLMKMANREYRFLRLKKGDSMIFSSSVIPGNERTVQFLKDQFYRQGAHVFNYKMMDIHASGHGYQEELKRIINIMKPKFFMPIHGQYSMLFEHANLAEEQGINRKNIIIADNGDIILFNKEKCLLEKNKVPSNYVMVDGLGIGDVGEVVLRDRQTLSQDGMFTIVVVVDGQTGKVKGSPDIISRGFVYLRESKDLLKETRQIVIRIVEESTLPEARTVNSSYIKDELRNQIGDFLFKQTKRRPMVLPVVIEV
jgi:ribonuclease J